VGRAARDQAAAGPSAGGPSAGTALPLSPYQEATDRAHPAQALSPVQPLPVEPQPPLTSIGVRGAPIALKGAPVRAKNERVEPNPYHTPALTTSPPPRRSRRFHWKLGAAAVVFLMAGIAAGRSYLPGLTEAAAPVRAPAPVAATAPAAPQTGTLILSTAPPGARVLVDGLAAGETPLTLDAVRPGKRTVTFVASGGSISRTVHVVAGEAITLDVPVFSGWLAVDAPILLEVAQKGRVLGSTRGRLLLPPGRHTVTLTNRELGYQATQTIDIVPGEERRLVLVPSTEVNLNASPWAEVWIDGKHVGETPIARLSIPLGTREVIFKNPQFGERRLTPTIRVGAPAALSVDFTRPGAP
jgi:eukaryotic-like serine/threonine-protein kinase